MADQGRQGTRNEAPRDGVGEGRRLTDHADRTVPGDAGGITTQDTTGAAGTAGSDPGPDDASVNMVEVIDRAKGMAAGDLPDGRAGGADEEADRIRRAADHMATGNVPHGGDDPQHRTNTPMSPMPADTGGKGNVGDTSLKDAGPDR